MVKIEAGPGAAGPDAEDASSADVAVTLEASHPDGSGTVAWLGLHAESLGDLPATFVGVELTAGDCLTLAGELVLLAGFADIGEGLKILDPAQKDREED